MNASPSRTAEGRKLAHVYYEEAAERRRLLNRLSLEEAVWTAQVIARALTDAAKES